MFVRKIKHSNGKFYIQVVEKNGGKYVVKKSFGAGTNDLEVEALVLKANQWIKANTGLQ